MRQSWKWLLHLCDKLSQQRALYNKNDTAHTIRVLKCSKQTILVARSKAPRVIIVDDERKGWPATQILSDRGSVRAEKLEIEKAWRCKYDLSPSSVHVHQFTPFPWSVRGLIDSIRVEYFEQNIVWERVDRCCISVTLAYATQVNTCRSHHMGTWRRTLCTYFPLFLAATLRNIFARAM